MLPSSLKGTRDWDSTKYNFITSSLAVPFQIPTTEGFLKEEMKNVFCVVLRE